MAESIHQAHNYGQFDVFYQYVEADRERGEEPCMILGSRGTRRTAWVIPLSNAHQYADSSSGGPSQFLILSAAKIAEMFNLHPDRSTVRKIAEAILDCLPDLVKMPPKRPESTKAILEKAVEDYGLELSINGKKVVH